MSSRSACKEFRKNSGFELLEALFKHFAKCLSPEKSDEKTGLPDLLVVQQLEYMFDLASAAVVNCSESLIYFDQVLDEHTLAQS